MQRLVPTVIFVLAVLLTARPAMSIVIRHDRDDDAYRAIAESYPMVVQVGGGCGTLIDPEWILTAGHVAEAFPLGTGRIRVGDQELAVSEVHIHPRYADGEDHRDLGLLRLAERAIGVHPALLYAQDDEAGCRVTFVGNGYSGTGKTGPSKGERIRRGAHNTVERVDAGWLVFRFDAPPQGDEMEGISGPGDSGGPALIDVEGVPYVAGVSAYNDGKPTCKYGSHEYYSRVSKELDWIQEVLAGRAPKAEPRAMLFSTDESGQANVQRSEPKSVEVDSSQDAGLWIAIEGLHDSIAAGDEEAYLALFDAAFVQQRQAQGDPLTGLQEFMAEVERVRGPIVTFHPDPPGFELEEEGVTMRPVIFHLEDGTSGYFGIALDDEGEIVHFSLFVRAGICKQGTDCEVAKPLASARSATR